MPYTSLNSTGRHIIVSDGSYFVCGKCCDTIVKSWQNHNKGPMEPYAIETAKISVEAETKKEFQRRVLPQIITKFKKLNWYVPKSDIRQALAKTIKG